MRIRSLTWLIVVLAVPLAAQQYRDSVTVNVVEVPVYVERFGVPVTGLTREDFELFVNGRPQPIEYFEVLERERSAATGATVADGETAVEAAPPLALKFRRLIVLLFDVGGSSSQALHRARIQALETLGEGRSGDAYAVATIGRYGVQFLVPFTPDRLAVQRAIGTLAPSGAADPFRVATLSGERSAWSEAAFAGETGLASAVGEWGGEPQGFRISGTPVGGYAPRCVLDTMEQVTSDRPFIRDLTDLADRLALLSGVKHVVLLSERSDGAAASPFGSNFRVTQRMHEHFRAAGVVLDGVDIRLPFSPGGDAQFQRPDRGAPYLWPSAFLYALALDTGGTVTSSFARLEHLNGITYLLGFVPASVKNGTNSVRVQLKNAPFLTEMRYRRSFTIGTETKDDSLFLADTLLNDIPQAGVTVGLEVKETSIAVSIPGAELLAYAAEEPLTLDVFIYVFDANGRAVVWNQLQLRVDPVNGRDFLTGNPYTIRQEVRLTPGRYAAKALVRVAGTESTGFRRADFVVPSS